MYESDYGGSKMMDSYKSGVYLENGRCYVDGALQATKEACKNVENFLIGSAIFGILITIFFAVLFIGLSVIWLITLIHLIQHEDVKDRNLWIVLHFVGLTILAGPIYYFAVKKPYDKSKKVSKPNTNSK